MFKQAFSSRDLTNPSLVALATKVGQMVSALNRQTGLETIIIEAFGTVIQHGEYKDETGYYITFRPHPGRSYLDSTKNACKSLTESFLAMFSGEHEVQTDPSDPNSPITVSIITGMTMIAD